MSKALTGAVEVCPICDIAGCRHIRQRTKQMTDTDTVERVKKALAETLGDALDCTRTWDAWHYGTMSDGDFVQVADDDERLEELARAAIAVLPPAVPELARHQPCGCIVCRCESDEQCSGCGAKNCGTHAVGEIPNPVYVTTPDPVAEAAKVLLDAANNGLDLFDIDGPNDLEGLAVKWSGNRGDAVIQLEIAEEFMREALRALTKDGEDG